MADITHMSSINARPTAASPTPLIAAFPLPRNKKHLFGDTRKQAPKPATQCPNPPSGAAADVELLAETRAWLFERSEFPSPPPTARADAETLRPWGRLSLAPKQEHVFGDARMRIKPSYAVPKAPSGAAADAALLAEKRAWLFERSEFPSPPPKARADAEILRPWGRLSLPTFFGDAKKVGGRAAVKRNLKKSAELDL